MNPVHNAPVPPPPSLLTSDRKQPLLLHCCCECSPELRARPHPKKKKKKKKQICSLRFFRKNKSKRKKIKKKQIRSLISYFLFCFFIFVNLREGEKNRKKQIQKKKQIRSRIGLCGSFLGECRIGIAETVNGSERPVSDGRTD